MLLKTRLQPHCFATDRLSAHYFPAPISVESDGVWENGAFGSPIRLPAVVQRNRSTAAGRWCFRWCRAARGVRVAEQDVDADVDVDLLPVAHLGPWSGSASGAVLRAASAPCGRALARRARVCSHRAAAPASRSCWRSTRVAIAVVPLADQQVALPVARHPALVGVRVPLSDDDHVESQSRRAVIESEAGRTPAIKTTAVEHDTTPPRGASCTSAVEWGGDHVARDAALPTIKLIARLVSAARRVTRHGLAAYLPTAVSGSESSSFGSVARLAVPGRSRGSGACG